MKDRSSRQMRSLISELPDGVYSAEDFLDNDGIEDEPLRVALDLKIDGEKLDMSIGKGAFRDSARVVSIFS